MAVAVVVSTAAAALVCGSSTVCVASCTNSRFSVLNRISRQRGLEGLAASHGALSWCVITAAKNPTDAQLFAVQ